MKRALRVNTTSTSLIKSDCECIDLTNCITQTNMNDLFIDLTKESAQQKDHETPVKSMKLTKPNRIGSPSLRTAAYANLLNSGELKSIAGNMGKSHTSVLARNSSTSSFNHQLKSLSASKDLLKSNDLTVDTATSSKGQVQGSKSNNKTSSEESTKRYPFRDITKTLIASPKVADNKQIKFKDLKSSIGEISSNDSETIKSTARNPVIHPQASTVNKEILEKPSTSSSRNNNENFRLDTVAINNYPNQQLSPSPSDIQKRRDSYSLIPCLLGMDLDFIPNMNPFECKVCLEIIEPGNGIILYECLHEFCKECLNEQIKAAEEFNVKCPFDNCAEFLREREIKAIVTPEAFEKHIQKSLKIVEQENQLMFHCRTPDCPVFMEAAVGAYQFVCPSCKKQNCIRCKAIHEGMSCENYQQEIIKKAQTEQQSNDIMLSEDAIRQMIAKNEAMLCPKCSIPVMKVNGCDFVTCTACKLGICWITKKPRITFKKADGSIVVGCRCREPPLMKKCHPLCNYCH